MAYQVIRLAPDVEDDHIKLVDEDGNEYTWFSLIRRLIEVSESVHVVMYQERRETIGTDKF